LVATVLHKVVQLNLAAFLAEELWLVMIVSLANLTQICYTFYKRR
jgi:hypothetical protein